MNEKKKILILNGQYSPGYKGGGPIQSCINMVENLYNKFDFYILCADRDYKEDKEYSNVKVNTWNQVGNAKVYYISPDNQTLRGFKEIINSIDYDVLYLNGFFSPIFTIRPLILRRFNQLKNKKARVILTPRGDFTGGCENKKLKKYTYIFISKLLGLYKKILWHATSDIEKKDIKIKFKDANIFTVPNLSAKFEKKKVSIDKKIGELRIVFISRIFPKKNLKFALDILKNINKGNIIFDIYGPMEDKLYWEQCKQDIKEMKENINIKYCGEVEHNKISYVFSQYHVFFFPTLGENYGHVIVEAMMNNCLCILSKGVTPWDDYIDKLQIGSELSNKEKFIKDINRLTNMNQEDINKILKLNNKYIEGKTNCEENIIKYYKMFNN